MKKWFLRIGLFSAGLLGLFVGTLFFLLGTQTGTNVIVTVAERQLAGQLQIGNAHGTLLDRLQCSDITFSSPAAGTVTLQQLILDWESSRLLKRHLHIIELQANGIDYTAPAATEEKAPTPGPVLLPELSLPFAIEISHLSIETLRFLSPEASELFTITQARLTATWPQAEPIQIEELFVAIPELSIGAKGDIHPQGNYPLHLSTTATTLSPELPALTLHGTYGGDLMKLTAKETLRGDFEALLEGTVTDPINALAWDAKLSIEQFRPDYFSPDIPGTVTGQLTTAGTLKGLTLQSTLHIRDEAMSNVNWDAAIEAALDLETLTIELNSCNLTHANAPAAIALKGTADMEEQLDIALTWNTLQWPLTGVGEYQSAAGSLTLTGRIDDYQLTLATDIDGAVIPKSNIQLSAKGNRESAQDILITLNTLEGETTVQGTVHWSPTVAWQIDTAASGINPGMYHPDWPGVLGWSIKSKGKLEESGVFADVWIENISGTLRSYPVSGTGGIVLNPETIQLDAVQFFSGNAKLLANGILADNSALQWDLQIPELSALLPEGSGTVTATGTLSGDMKSPQVKATLKGTSVHVPQVAIDDLSVSTDIDLSWRAPFALDLTVNNLRSGANRLSTINLAAGGKLDDHNLSLVTQHLLGTANLELTGGYHNRQWQGLLNTLAFDIEDVGLWQNKQPAALTAGTDAASLQPICLGHDEGKLCVGGQWDSDNRTTGGELTLNQIPLNTFAPWFPETVTDLTGDISLQAKASLKENLQATAHARISPGEIHYISLKKEGSLPHEGLKLDLEIADDGLSTDLWCSINTNTISGSLHSPDLLSKNPESSPQLDGTLDINIYNFNLVETLFEDVTNLDASIDSKFTVTGSLEAPIVDGKGTVQVNYMLIPAAGLELSETSLDILADTKTVTLDGILNSGKGAMQLNSILHLDPKENFPAHLTLKGQNFRVVNLPEIQVYLSSDLIVEKTKDLTTLSGTVAIPKADVLLRNLPTGTETASPDIVIKQEQTEEVETKSPVHMDLRVSLGRKVYFAGFGVNAFIDGQLNIKARPEEQMLGSGEFHIRQGSYRAYGQDLEINNGVISFPGGPLTQPGINLRATRTIGDVVAGLSVIGPMAKPRITTFSNPAMSESQILSYIITGSSPSTGGAKLSVGRQINNKLSVAVGTDTKTGESQFVARYRLNRKIHVETTTGTDSNAADIFYSTELGGKEPEKKQ